MTTLVLVESPAKAKALQNYLGKQYTVLATYGHVRDIVPKSSSIKVDDKFDIVWEISENSTKHITAITKVANKADSIILATDPDREGEAIAWHILTILQESSATIATKPFQRAVFHEISKKAVLAAIDNAQPHLDHGLIDSYRTRRSLDFLLGFNISPILWRKLPCCRSAGRVQSTALRLVCDRALEIDVFQPQEYWSIQGIFTHDKTSIEASLAHIAGKPIKKETLPSEAEVQRVVDDIKTRAFHLAETQVKKISATPAPPFTTSTLQQAGNKAFNWSTTKIMQVAQSLYEGVDIQGTPVGLITYMRTDSTRIAPDFIDDMRAYIQQQFGPEYCPDTAITHTNKTKNAQEAHEAIRPTQVDLTPKAVQNLVTKDQHILYSLIWSRALASQMSAAIREQKTHIITDPDKAFTFRASVTALIFKGYLAVYPDKDDGEDGKTLAPLEPNTPLKIKEITPQQHFTKPPPYFTEATLIQALEERGIGRPSTYAPTLQMLFKRKYVNRLAKQLHPSLPGRILTLFLTKNLPRYVQDDFTATMEDSLDDIAQQKKDWLPLLEAFWKELKSSVEQAASVDISTTFQDALKILEHLVLTPHKLSAKKPLCPKCQHPMTIKGNKFGFFLGCTHYPECKTTLSLTDNKEDMATPDKLSLGIDPATGLEIISKKGPYGPYLEIASDPIKRIPITAAMQKSMPDLDTLSILLSLPKPLGTLGKDKVTLMMGRYGPFLKVGKTLCTAPMARLKDLSLDDVPALVQEALEKKKKK